MNDAGPLLERAEAFARERAAQDPPFLAARRREARALLAERGLPTAKWEEWRYTSLSAALRPDWQVAPDAEPPGRGAVERLSVPVYACSLFVFLNGRFAPELSSPPSLSGGVRVQSLEELAREDPKALEELLCAEGTLPDGKVHPFAALHAAFQEDGAAVVIPRDRELANPVHLVFLSRPAADGTPAMTFPRVVVHAGPGSRAAVIQDHVSLGEGALFTDAVTQLRVDANARLDHVLLQREDDGVFHVANVQARLARDARLDCHAVSLGGALVRNDAEALLAEEGSECHLRGLALGTGRRVVDNHTLVDHAVPHCSSRELYKAVLAGRSRGVFRGRVIVRPDAQKTDADQHNPNLLLSDEAEVDTKPQLEIWADDVRCSHGSTIGQIDPDQLFYLRSRGLPEARARELLTRGFATEITRSLPSQALGELVGDLLVERLEQGGQDA